MGKQSTQAKLNRQRAKAIYNKFRSEVYKEANFTCQLCFLCDPSGKKLSLDHIKPLKHGGSNEKENLRCLCRDCNTTLDQHPHPYLWIAHRREVIYKVYAGLILQCFPTISSVSLDKLTKV